MTLILFGEPSHWSQTLELLQTYRPDIQIYGFSALDLGPYANEDVTYTLREVETLFKNHIIDGVLQIHAENPYHYFLLMDLGISDIYIIPHTVRLALEHNESVSPTQLVRSYHDVLPELIQLEFHLADHCNLNCKGCSHFSNLVPTPSFADMEQFKKDLHQLTTYFSQIHKFFLLGGEPLLNPDIEAYITLIREAFPYTQIIIVTNGILLLTLKEPLLNTIKKNHVHISISDYTCLDREKIIAFVQKHSLSAELREGKENFSKYLNTKGTSDPNTIFYQCIRHNCTFLGKGKIAACCQPFLVHYFNEYFGEQLPEGEGIDLYDTNLTGWDIQRKLTSPMDSCRYCTFDESFDWAVSKAPYSKDDWCVS